MWSIYVIRNAATEKLYVGQTVKNPPTKRWSDHLYRCRSGERKRLYESIRKHGVVAFEFTVIERWETQADANEAEEFWVSFFRSWDAAFGYNMTLGGDGSVLSPSVIEHLRELNVGERNPFHGRHHSEDAKRKIGKAAKNRSSETKQKLSAARVRNRDVAVETMRKTAQRLWADPAHRAAMSKKRRGRKVSNKTRQLMSNSAKRRTARLGESAPNVKLTRENVNDIARRLDAGEKQGPLAREFDVSLRTISSINTRTSTAWQQALEEYDSRGF